MLSVYSDMNLSIWESRCWKDKRGCGGRGWGPPPERGLCTPVPSTADQPRDPPNPRLRPQDRQLEMTNQRCTDDRPPSFYACKSRKIISPPLLSGSLQRWNEIDDVDANSILYRRDHHHTAATGDHCWAFSPPRLHSAFITAPARHVKGISFAP